MKRFPLSCWLGLLALGAFAALAGPVLNPVTPAEQSASLGATVQFKLTIKSGAGPYTYQWWHGSAVIDTNLNPSAAKNTLSLTNVALADAGEYTVVVTDTTGPTTSTVATLKVTDEFKVIPVMFDDPTSDGSWPFWFDFDGDGWLEVVVLRGSSGGGRSMDAYENNQDGTFTKVSNGLTTLSGAWNMAACADFDGDGRVDLFAVQVQPADPVLFLNQGNGKFNRITLTKTRIVNRIPIPGQAGTVGDYDADGLPDLFISYWADWGGAGFNWNRQVRNRGQGYFEVITNSPLQRFGLRMEGYQLVDYDGDGDLDLYSGSTDDPPQHQLLQQQADGTFLPIESHPLVDFPGTGFGAAWGDYNNDGKLDALLTHWYETNLLSYLYRGLGGGQFEVDTNLPPLPRAWYCSWADYDNDGNLDLFVPLFDDQALLFHNNGDGTFTQRDSPCIPVVSGFWADFNNDGFLDLLGDGSAHQLLENNLPQLGNTNHWLKVQFRGSVSSTEGIGVKVFASANIRGKTVRQMRHIIGGILATDLIAHFGLGDAAVVDTLRIEWPSGLVQELKDVAANQFLTITEHEDANPPAPTLTAAPSDTGAVKLTLTGQPHCGYVIQGSDDLVNWVKVRGCHTLTGTVEHTDLKVAGKTARYYRALVP